MLIVELDTQVSELVIVVIINQHLLQSICHLVETMTVENEATADGRVKYRVSIIQLLVFKAMGNLLNNCDKPQ